MLETEPSYRPLQVRNGYLPHEDLAVIGDGATIALVGRDGSIPWMCLPRFDSDPVFCALLDRQRGGHFTVAPEGLVESRQRYETDTALIVTEMKSRDGVVRLTDAFALRPGADITDDEPATRQELVRSAVVLDGRVRLRAQVHPRGGATADPAHGGLDLHVASRRDLALHLRANRHPTGLDGVYELAAGDRLDLVLSWDGPRRHHRFEAVELLDATAAAWRRWINGCTYAGPEEPLVRRAALTLKLCDHWSNGALVAAPTSSMPAPVGGERNWDYRYTWVRDAAFSVYALRRIGYPAEANAFLGWVLDAFEESRGPRIMYALSGGPVPDEWEDPELEGYRVSSPVRWGNGAADQRQHDVYGEVLDCAYQWVSGGGAIEPYLWNRLATLADTAEHAWREPDQGIWEIRSAGRVFTYSAALCQVALDRAAKLGERLGLRGRVAEWRAAAESLRQSVLEDAWDDERQTLSEHLGGGGTLDASLLALPLRRVIPADHPRMVATTAAIAERLSAGNGLLYRYLHDASPDGITGDEGAFMLCSFWLVDNLTKQGRIDEAGELYASLCGRASGVGLLPEQIDPTTGSFVGNFPQAFSHIGVIASGVALTRALNTRG
ncbi:MAG: glycoside hydrolase family 15 protein [Acidimicrobiia bacterium]